MGNLVETVDWIDLGIVLLIGSMGLFVLLSVGKPFFVQQLGFFALGLVCCWALSRVDSALLAWAAPFGYLLCVLFLAMSYLGPSIRGATRWVTIAGVQLQPSELVKPFVLLGFAWAMRTFPVRTVRGFLFQVALFLPPFVLVLRQPDFGTSIVYAGAWVSMMIAAGFPLRSLLVGALAAIFLLPWGWQSLHAYQRERITTFLRPGADPKGAGYNAIQSMIAVGSGQLFGRGLGRGTQSHLRFLPEYHTDFIFATLVEEQGFLGGLILLLAYGVLLWRMLPPLASRASVPFFAFVARIGFFSMILTQVAIHTGMNMGLVPIAGVTLPLVSYGGSSLLSVFLSLGTLWSLRRSVRTGRIQE